MNSVGELPVLSNCGKANAVIGFGSISEDLVEVGVMPEVVTEDVFQLIGWKILFSVFEHVTADYYLSVVVDSDFRVHTKALIFDTGQPPRGSGGRDILYL